MRITLPVRSTLLRFIDAILPPRCPATGALVGVQGTLSPEYWSQLHFIHKPVCACCGNPFPHDIKTDMLCGKCMTEPPLYDTARAAIAYDDASSALILRFKYADKTLLARSFAPWLLQASPDALVCADYLVPVPLHRWRLLKRRYNQAALLANALSTLSQKPHLPLALLRTRKTESQGKKSKAERLDNIRGAFSIADKFKDKIKNKNIILIDDVLTSGATVNECAKVLRAAGAARIDVLTLARIVHTV